MIHLDGHRLNLDQIWQIAVQKRRCAICLDALPGMKKSRALVEQFAEEPRAIYGINTGFGPLSGTRVEPQDLKKHQLHLLHHLSVGQGPLFSESETRAIMAARANALVRGFSGVRITVVKLLLDVLNADILPEIPTEGSVGASGDLVPLAHMSRLLVGLGYARVGGERELVKVALQAHGLAPVVLETKDGLSLVNGTSVMTGITALSVVEAGQILSWMEFLSTWLIQVLNGAPEILCEQVHKARGHRGQHYCAARMTHYLRGNANYAREIDEHHWGTRPHPLAPGVEIQDPYSLRCVPQILGAFQDALWHVEGVVTQELNASTDNPLFFASSGTVIHSGNFYGQHVAMVSDYLRIGLISLALLSERQTERLMNWRYNTGLPPMLTGADPGLNSGMAGCQLLATSLAAEARLLGIPASIQSIPTNANNQDVVSMGTSAAKMTRQVLPMLWKLLAVEVIALAQSAEAKGIESEMGEPLRNFLQELRAVSPRLREDRPLYEDIGRVVELLRSEQVHAAYLQPRPYDNMNLP